MPMLVAPIIGFDIWYVIAYEDGNTIDLIIIIIIGNMDNASFLLCNNLNPLCLSVNMPKKLQIAILM